MAQATSRTCQQTGLVLAPSTGQSLTRIQKVSWGPLNPPVRGKGKDPDSWGRYDVAGHRTVYGGTPAKAAYAESLANQRVSAKLKTLRLGDLFDDSDASDPQTTLAAITDEWNNLYGGMTPGKVVLGWRDARLEYCLTLPTSGWFIDIEASESVASINRHLRGVIGTHGLQALTVGDLRGENRSLTTAVAQWIHGLTLDDGSRPHGITFCSKHGTDLKCAAIWLRVMDDADPHQPFDISLEPTKADNGKVIELPQHNPPLHAVANLFNLTIY